MPRSLSGIQTSGNLTLGNYLGALKQHVSFQDKYDAIYFVADLHAITVRQEPKELLSNTYNISAWYVACGLDTKKSTLFVQSHVRAHTELGWILNTFAQMGELERMTQFKDKSQRHKHNINAGLFTYPVLQAADILLYHANVVPVGEDQKQHIELTRDVATRFNGIYGDILTLPEHFTPKQACRIKDLAHPERKMSKSLPGNGCVLMSDPPETIVKKFKKATTDNDAAVRLDETNQPGITNLLNIYASMKNITSEQAAQEFGDARYGDFKLAVAESVVEVLRPIQEKYNTLMHNRDEIATILRTGAERAETIADKTLKDVKTAVGFLNRR